MDSLARQVGETIRDASSGHERWRIYRRAADLRQTWDLLLEAIRHEPDPSIASAVVVQLLERASPDIRSLAVAALPEGKQRDFAETRSREIGILEALSTGHGPPGEARDNVDSWSTWLQLRVSSNTDDERVLEELAEAGRTKRVRGAAAQRLRSLNVNPPAN